MNYRARIQKFQHIISNAACELFLVDHPLNLYYLTGLSLSAGKMLVWADKEPILIVDNRYYEMCVRKTNFPVKLAEKFKIEEALQGVSRLGFDSENTSYQNYLNLQKLLNNIQLVPLNNPLLKIRCFKDEEEIRCLREAAALGKRGYEHVKGLLKEGISEKALAIELEIFWKTQGGEGLAFEPIIAFGENSAMPHYRAGDTQLKRGDTVLMDMGVKWNAYHSDLSRTLFWGDPPAKIQEIYSIVQEAQTRAIKACRPGVLIGDLDEIARGYITEKGFGEQFLHSLGHGVGLEIHEWPILRNKDPYRNEPLKEGMVITIEPGIYIPGMGGVRIEDMVHITADGYEVF